MVQESSAPDNRRWEIFTPALGTYGVADGFPICPHKEARIMLRWALIFFIVALIAAVLGFTGIALAAAGVAKVLFYVFVILFVLSLLGHVARRP
jgi:uncharacterized membrane protein YtjA (UPF0391 family)